ncbi:hypothetical protein [Glutamicibacter arilaitensis]|uniref:hypothetical protein n=1 Tax=Glutamicibacter arilaitensis TaxID=256701 RepID=UPI003F924106
MTPKVQWINPFITEVSVVPEGTPMPDGYKSEDEGTLVIKHDDDLMICMDSPLDVRDFLTDALNKVQKYINENGL